MAIVPMRAAMPGSITSAIARLVSGPVTAIAVLTDTDDTLTLHTGDTLVLSGLPEARLGFE